MTSLRLGWKLLGVFCLLSFTLAAQITTGTVSGNVTDSTGAAIPGASVVILNENNGVTRTILTDAAGRYSAPQLGLGNYRLSASREGFQTQIRSGVVLTVGREATVNFELPVGAVSERVEVTGEAPLVQTTEATLSYLVDDKTIRDMPLNGRDVSQLILLNPGVVQNHNGKWGNADKGFGRRFGISGMRGEDNSFLLDGSYINDYYRHLPAGPTGALVGVETVREFQMLTASFSASYGRALGGVFNAVTKSGTNEFHGSVYEFLRNSALDAANYFDKGGVPPFRRNHFGATLGGPVFRDKTFFFVAYEGLREALSQTTTSNVFDVNARQGILPGGRTVAVSPLTAPFLKLFPLPTPGGRNFGDGTAEYIFAASQPTQDDFGQARIDQQISSNDSLFGRYTISNSSRAVVRGYPGHFEVGAMKTRLFSLSETHVFSPRLLSTFRFSYNHVVPGTDHIVPQTTEAALISVPGNTDVAAIDPGSGIAPETGTEQPGSYFATHRFAFQDDLNLSVGNHSLQFGGMLERMRYNSNNPFRPYGEWRFPNVAGFLAAQPDRFRGSPLSSGNFVRGARQWFMALFVQDDWRVSPSLTLNLGVRWEPFSVPTEVNNLIENLHNISDTTASEGGAYWKNGSWVDFSPRVGFAWSPFKSERTSVRGGFGLFFSPLDSSVYTVPLVRSNAVSPNYTITNPVGFPNALAAIAANKASGTPDIYGVPFDHFDTPHAIQYSLSIQQQIGANNVVTIGYSGRRGINLTSYGNYNLPFFTYNGNSLELPANAPAVRNPVWHNINYVETNASSSYNGLSFTLQRRFAAGLQGQISYTYSKALSEADGSDTGNHVTAGGAGALKYPYDLRVSRGLSGYNQTQVFSANYAYDLPVGKGLTGVAGHLLSGWQLTGIVSLQSGQPFGVTAIAPRTLSDYFTDVSPNLNLGVKPILGDPEGFIDFRAFSPPGSRELGNLGRLTLTGPGFAQWDFGMTKNTTLTERLQLQFRLEMFNLTDRVNFAVPGQSGQSGGRGEIFTRTGDPIPSATVIRGTVNTSRQIQLGLKLVF